MKIKSKFKIYISSIILKTPNVVLTMRAVVAFTLLIAVLISIPIFQDYNSRSFPKYEIVCYKEYEIQSGDTLSEIAEKYKPKYMKLSNYIVEIQYANGIGRDIYTGDKLLIPVLVKN